MNTLAKQTLPWREQIQLTDEFIGISTCLNEEAKQKIRASVHGALATVETVAERLAYYQQFEKASSVPHR